MQHYKGIALITYYRFIARRLFLAENCLLAQPIERLLWRKLPLKLAGPVAIYDPQRTLDEIVLTAENGTHRTSI